MLVFFDVILRVLSLSKEEGINANVYCKSIYSIIDKGKDRMHTILFTFFHCGCGYLFHFHHSMRMEKNS